MSKKPSILDVVDWRAHPGPVESLAPIWGSGREALADFYDGDYVGAVGNGLLAITDIVPGVAGVKLGAKVVRQGGQALIAGKSLKRANTEAWRGVVKSPKQSTTWDAVRKDMTKSGVKESGEHGHHSLIPQGGWGARVPNVIKNQPILNIKVLSPENHARIHGAYKGKAQFDPVRRVWYGTTDTAKHLAAEGVAGIYEAADRWRKGSADPRQRAR